MESFYAGRKILSRNFPAPVLEELERFLAEEPYLFAWLGGQLLGADRLFRDDASQTGMTTTICI